MKFNWDSFSLGSKNKTKLWIQEGKAVEMEVIRGIHPGKQLVVTAGMHGCEYVGIQAARRLYDQLKPESMHGTVIVLPLLNVQGFLQGIRQNMPEDGKNLNRVFPGQMGGSYTEKLAAIIESELYPVADFLLDLHGGDINESLTPLVFYPATADTQVTLQSVEVTKHLTVPFRVASSAKNGLYSRAAQCGVPALLLERGCLGQWSEQEVMQTLDDIKRVMASLGILQEEYRRKEQREIGRAIYEEAQTDGLWYPSVQAGGAVQKGNLLGELYDLKGNLIQRCCAEWDGTVLYYTTSLGVKAGDALIAYGS